MTLHADLVVVGGGPAGSAAATAALENNPDLTVIVLEQRAQPQGTCAGGAGMHWFNEMTLNVPDHLESAPICEVGVYGPSTQTMIHAKDVGLDKLGVVLDRPRFDQWLLAQAEGKGAWVMRNTRFTSIMRRDGRWLVDANNDDGLFSIHTPYVVDASGPQAVVAKQLGLDIDEDPEDVHVGLQYTIPLPKGKPLDRIEMWFKRDPMTPTDWACRSGYVWSFPATNHYFDYSNPVKHGLYTRLGVGVDKRNNQLPGRNAKDVLDNFLDHHSEFERDIKSVNGGHIPTGKPLQTAFNGVFVCGDAGRHVSALHGGGIWFARVAGTEAGKAAAQGHGDKEFEHGWKERIGFTLKAHYAMKKVLYELSNKEIDIVIDELDDYEPETPNPVHEIRRASKIFLRHPVLSGKNAVKLLKGLVTA